MALEAFTLDEKIAAVDIEITEARKFRRDPGSAMQRHYQILKSVNSDLRARQELPRSNALGALQREIDRLIVTKDPTSGYHHGRLLELANVVISKWPTIMQSLESFGEESAE